MICWLRAAGTSKHIFVQMKMAVRRSGIP
uniref:Uncharacterized protein n=1 Tax=Anguilla anguilla TaxID=7936 RepID=A0A0E9PQL6_ANGAN